MARFHLGVGAKLNLALGVVLLCITATFGVSYALLERNMVLDIEREHLTHLASLARLYLADVGDRDELEAVVSEFNKKLASSRRAPHRLVVEDSRGEALATSNFGKAFQSTDGGPHRSEQGPRVEMAPSVLRAELPLRLERYTPAMGSHEPSRIVLFESLPRIGEMFQTSVLWYLGFGAGLVGLAMLAAGAMTHRLVVRPVRQLVAATDEIARDGLWGLIEPSERRQDEIGVLEDHLAEMSRRLVEAVRAERYGSAHLVVERVRREIEGPLRRSAKQLTVLEELLPRDDSDAACARSEVASELEKIADIVRRLESLPPSPPG
jgi:HAMP domain-containing protein